ncbi:hypothetical protein ES705_24694 [subsurface metagenome]
MGAARPKPLGVGGCLGLKVVDCGRTPPPATCGQHAPQHPGTCHETMTMGLWAG